MPEVPSAEDSPVLDDVSAWQRRIQERFDALQHRPARSLDDDIGPGL